MTTHRTAQIGKPAAEQLLPLEYERKHECTYCGAPSHFPCNADQEGRFLVHAHPQRLVSKVTK